MDATMIQSDARPPHRPRQAPTAEELGDRTVMPTNATRDLDEELMECKVALQSQAQAMLELLLQFEARLQQRLDAAEARIVAARASSERPAEARGLALSDPRVHSGVGSGNGSPYRG